MADLLTASDESAALEDLHTRGFTDGLPVIIPTPARVSRMVLASGLEADMVLGTMGPGHGIATIEKVAVAAVMAGCLPDYMPVVLAAVKAVIDPAFDLTEMQATTHCTAPLIIVNGPARHTCGPISSSYGALGPGHRANASIGRALRLTMINIGGGRPGTSDMALLGHPGKFTFCLAEDEENSPFPPMHVDLGFDPDDSVVTVIGAEAPHSVLYSGDGDDPNGYKSLLAMLAIGIANAATNNAILTGGSATIVLNPEHADVLIKAGLTRQDIAEEIHQRSTIAETAINKLAPGFARKDSGNRDAFKGPEQLLILMSGGSGLYSMVMPSWCAGPHKNSASSIKVESEFFCEVPGLANLVI
ncbi:MAG: hypothetical protein HOI67_03165 [Gammaproteobacteria bacterium]|jgi:hypothetical protein|nr:hypothetical protein [Gammaproteobacteria bacterium]|tara:strand:+ start:530 stop:1606 length:1077 start_codon:yes stop_codon:yes gene_type:complete